MYSSQSAGKKEWLLNWLLHYIHLAGDIRMVRACMKCCTPQVFPQTWIWGRNWEDNSVSMFNHWHDNNKWELVSLTNLKEVCSPLANSSRTAQKMAQQVQVLCWSSNMQQDCHLESGPEPCEETKQQNTLTHGTWTMESGTVFVHVYQSVQPVMDVSLKLCVIQDSPCEAEQDADGLFQGLKRTRLCLAARTIC